MALSKRTRCAELSRGGGNAMARVNSSDLAVLGQAAIDIGSIGTCTTDSACVVIASCTRLVVGGMSMLLGGLTPGLLAVVSPFNRMPADVHAVWYWYPLRDLWHMYSKMKYMYLGGLKAGSSACSKILATHNRLY